MTKKIMANKIKISKIFITCDTFCNIFITMNNKLYYLKDVIKTLKHIRNKYLLHKHCVIDYKAFNICSNDTEYEQLKPLNNNENIDYYLIGIFSI
jgi:hypothetical protein